jgi:thiamine biosynthesis lipoprotein
MTIIGIHADHPVQGRRQGTACHVRVAALLLLLGLDLAARAASGPLRPAESHQLQRFDASEPHMGTLVRISVYARTGPEARAAFETAFARIAALDRTLSDYRPDSELSRLAARAGGGSVRVSDDLFAVLAASQRYAELSGGAFDMTGGALTHLWRRARRLSELPPADRVAEARARSGHRWLALDAAARTATIRIAGVELDAGGLAEGYAADEALAAMAGTGVTRALVTVGGDIAAGEAPPGRDGWIVAFEGLTLPGAPRLAPVSLRNGAMSTSGDSEQWMTAGGVRYSHILDLRTGWPMTGRTATSVMARRGLDADALDTAVAILGPHAGMPLIEQQPGAAAVWMIAGVDGSVTVERSSRWPEGAKTGDRRPKTED